MLLARGPSLCDRLAVEMFVAQTAAAKLRLLHGRMREGRRLGLRHDPLFVQRRATCEFKSLGKIVACVFDAGQNRGIGAKTAPG